MVDVQISRRDTLRVFGVTSTALAFGGAAWPAVASEGETSRKRALRVAHLTDIHVQPERRAGEGMAQCLHHVQQLPDEPDLIITGGDSVMDSFAADDARTKLQWDVWASVLKNDCSIPVRSCIGNHDVWGWAKSKSHTTGRESLWGKNRAVEMLHLEKRYYSFAQGGWQFIVLDSIRKLPDGSEGYTAHLDEEQFDWLSRTLRDAPADTPLMIVSHIPIFSATPLILAEPKNGDFQFSGSWTHTDVRRLMKLFAAHPNVKICASGHMHLVERVNYNGVSYLCSGAVSANWWKGPHYDCYEGYAVIDLYDDGTFDQQYVTFGWQAEGA